MIIFRNKNGFTIVEVILALAIVSVILIPVFINQSVISRNTGRASRMITHMLNAKKILLETEFGLEDQIKETITEKKAGQPLVTYTYEIKKIPENSSLKNFKNLFIEQVSWPSENKKGKENKENLVTFLHKQEQKE